MAGNDIEQCMEQIRRFHDTVKSYQVDCDFKFFEHYILANTLCVQVVFSRRLLLGNQCFHASIYAEADPQDLCQVLADKFLLKEDFIKEDLGLH